MNAVIALALLAPAAAPAPEPPAPDVKVVVRTGLQWLAAQQAADGHWEGRGGLFPARFTSTAGIAFLMNGSTPKAGPYAANLRKIIAWMEKNSTDNGLAASDGPNEQSQHVPGHAQAMLFLACAYDVDDDKDRCERVAALLKRGVAFLAEYRSSRGGWGYGHPRDDNDYDNAECTTAALQALLATGKAGIEVPKVLTDAAVRYLVQCTKPDGAIRYGRTSEFGAGDTEGPPRLGAKAASLLLTHDGPRPGQLAGWVMSANSTNAPQQLQLLRNGGGYAMQYQYYLARVAYALGENGHRKLDPKARDENALRWPAHRVNLFKALTEAQGKDGNWPDPNYGPAYTTALALNILQLDNDYLPAFSR